MSFFSLKLVAITLAISTLFSFQVPEFDLRQQLGSNPISAEDQSKVGQLVDSVQASEWLGPLAPIAISPFFGITCLAGISQFGGDYLPVNQFLSTNPVLKNPAVFWVFLGLTILTSLPRFTKVSKPAAQAIDQLETYAGIITILVIRFLPGFLEGSEEPAVATVVQMGFLTFTADSLLAVAAVINILVINSVKFFFEVMVWLIPFPLIDAALEVANKALCLGLMSIYAFSPTIATLLNLLLFAICLVIFRWAHRRIVFMRTMIGDPIWSLVSKSYGRCQSDRLTVFPQSGWLGFPAKTRLILRPMENGWQVICPRLFRTSQIKLISRDVISLTLKEGLLVNSITVSEPEVGCLFFSRRYRNQSNQLTTRMMIELSADGCESDLNTALGSV